MSAPTLSQIMTGLKDRLATISGLQTTDFIADTATPPAAMVAVPDIPSYRATFGRGQVELEFLIYVFVGRQLDSTGQAALAGYASWTGANSIPLAIEGDRSAGSQTLGGIVNDCTVTSFRNLNMDEVAAYNFFGGEFTVLVLSPGV